MSEFFRGWKRKVGCVTLLLACLLTVAWIRSHFVHDWVDWGNRYSGEASSFAGILTTRDSLNVVSYVISQDPMSFDMEVTLPLILHDTSQWRLFSSPTYESSAQLLVVPAGPSVPSPPVPMPVLSLTLPYWCIVIPLTALSAWLLLFKSRTKIESAAVLSSG